MRILLRCCAIVSLVLFLALPVFVNAEETESYDKDAYQAESTPPPIPHRIKDTAGGAYCLDCHQTGLNGAPQTPHPERLTCTECHAQGGIKELRYGEKGKKNK